MAHSNTLLALVAVAALAATPALVSPALASPVVGSAGFTLTSMGRTDDSSSTAQSLGFTANFFGVNQTQLFVNNNGNVTFGAPQTTFTAYGLTGSLGGNVTGILAPFFADVDTRNTTSGIVSYGQGTYNGLAAYQVNWPGVGYYNYAADKLDDFQLLLVNRADTGTGNFDIYFNYGSMQWDTGSASNGSGGLCSNGGLSAAAGYSNGQGASYEIAGSHTCGALLDGGTNALRAATNDGTPGQFLFAVRNGTVAAVPEPATLALLGVGLTGLAALRRRRT